MGFNPESMISMMKKQREDFARSELKANRKKNGKWETVTSYPCSSQVIATRSISPRGYQNKWKDDRIDTWIPYKKIEYGFKSDDDRLGKDREFTKEIHKLAEAREKLPKWLRWLF